jgi:predicted HTH transcriptional regulator
MHFHGFQKQKPIPSYQIFKGTVFDLVDQSVDFVLSKLNRSVGTRALGPQAPVEYDIPKEVIIEGIVNAVAHRNYTSNASVEIMLFPDRLEIWNPGSLPPSLSIKGLRKPHASQPGNPLIAEPLFLTKYIEKAGSGIIDMYAYCRAAKMKPPKFRVENGFFILTVWRKQSTPTQPQTQSTQLTTQKTVEKSREKSREKNTAEVRRKYGESAEKVFSVIEKHMYIKTNEISDKTQLAQRTVEKAIAALKKDGVLKRIGPDKGGHWEIVE